MKIATVIARVLLGLVFVISGLIIFLHFIPMRPPEGAAGDFWIEQVLDRPELVEPDSYDPHLTHYVGRIQQYGNRALRVVLNIQATPVRIVTVFFDRKMKGRL